jgi:Family of unknown function (DUF6152)
MEVVAMTKKWPAVLLAGVCSLMFSVPSFAHHSQAWADNEHPVTLVGTVLSCDLINPHSEIWIEVKKDDGSTEKWLIEEGPVSGLRRAGWDTDTVKVGDKVKITAGAAKDGRKIVNGSVMTGPGAEFLVNGKPVPGGSRNPYGYGKQ